MLLTGGRLQEGRLAILGHICKTAELYICFLTSPHLSSVKEPGIQTPVRWLFEALACHLLGLPAPQLKSLPCLNTSSLRFIGLSCGEQSELGVGEGDTSVPTECGMKSPSVWRLK